MTTARTIRTVFTALATLLLTFTTSIAQETRPVDVVVMLDNSGSMEDLLDATRARVWDVVNELGRMKPTPELRVGLVSRVSGTTWEMMVPVAWKAVMSGSSRAVPNSYAK